MRVITLIAGSMTLLVQLVLLLAVASYLTGNSISVVMYIAIYAIVVFIWIRAIEKFLDL